MGINTLSDEVGDFAEFYARWVKVHPWLRDTVSTVLPHPRAAIIQVVSWEDFQ